MTSASRGRPALVLLVAAVAALAGCASKVPLNNVPATVETRDTTSSTSSSTTGSESGAPRSETAVTSVDVNNGSANGKLANTIYFDFDSYTVKEEFRPTVEGYSKLLNGDRKKVVQVEGHTDERGGREYNLALGQKRAEAVARSLTLLGATQGQVEAVSFGKERPAATGSDEAAWAKNRRAEIYGK